MELKCSNCGDNIDGRLANVQTDLVQCPNCFAVHKVSVLINHIHTSRPTQEIIPNEDYFLETPSYNNQLAIPPKGSSIDAFLTRSSLEIDVPKGRFKAEDAFLVVFATFWISFISVWTFFAAMGSVFFALFSLPFWFAGFVMVQSLFKKLTERQFIQLDNYTLKVTKQGLLSSKTVEFNLKDIDSIEFKKEKYKTGINTNNSKQSTLTPTITSGVKKVTIFNHSLDVEQEWAIELLNATINHFKNNY